MERRQITALFCDLVGSTALSARLDPEDLNEVMRDYYDRCSDIIEAAGGYVAQFQGDGIVAYFGYFAAHEGDAERATLAGLQLAKAFPPCAATTPASSKPGSASRPASSWSATPSAKERGSSWG